MADALRIVRFAVKRDRIACFVEAPDPARRYTTPAIARAAALSRPHLPAHACVNEAGGTFASVMARTSLAHLMEHVAIDLMVERSARDDALFAGTTDWVDAARGRARIEVSYADDLEALGALTEAARIVNRLVG